MTGRRAAWLVIVVGVPLMIVIAWLLLREDPGRGAGELPPEGAAPSPNTCLSTIETWVNVMVADQSRYYEVGGVLTGIVDQRRDSGDDEGMQAAVAAWQATSQLTGLKVNAETRPDLPEYADQYEQALEATEGICADSGVQEVVAEARVVLGY